MMNLFNKLNNRSVALRHYPVTFINTREHSDYLPLTRDIFHLINNSHLYRKFNQFCHMQGELLGDISR